MTAEEKLIANEYEDVIIYSNFGYDSALIGVSTDGQAIYDYDLMVEWLMQNEGMTYEDAVEWIENSICTNTGNTEYKYPIVMHRLLDFGIQEE